MYLPDINKRMKFQLNNGGPSQMVGFSNDFGLPQILGSIDEGKYGSVTKEFEAIKAERQRMISRLSVGSVGSVGSLGSVGPEISSAQKMMMPGVSDGEALKVNVIDLDGDDGKGNADGNGGLDSVVVVDSDDESELLCDNRVCEVGVETGKDDAVVMNQSDSLRKQVQSPTLHDDCRQLVLFDRMGSTRPFSADWQPLLYHKMDSHRAFKTDWQPTGSFQKVVLQKITDRQKLHDVVNEKDAELRSVRKDRVFGSIITSNQKSKRGRKRKVVEAFPEVTEKNYVKNHTPASPLSPSKVTEKEPEKNQTPVSPLSLDDNSPCLESQEDEEETSHNDGLDDLWQDMSFAMESSKGYVSHIEDESAAVEEVEDCLHSFLIEDDIGLVCRVCGIIQKRIETIFDFQWTKGSQSIRTYAPGSHDSKDSDDVVHVGPKVLEDDFSVAEVSIHPRHSKQIKSHQLEGFNFLVRNLVTDKPGGCILAHAPGSGKTFMIISFIQSFLAKYPSYRPLVVLPKGILPTWKREFKQWQVEDIPLYDFYSSKADSRYQQLEILKLWQENKSILFLGYKQLSTIICSDEKSNAATGCQEILLKVPNLLILDEGHTPRNEDTNVLGSLAKIQTSRKVVLTGTLFQNHVKEVFNILNLVRPKFIKTESSRAIVKRVLSRVHISGSKRLCKGGVENTFYDLVEENLQKSDDFKRKTTVIQDLRLMTKDVLHYYKGDFLDELPGLVDFTVVLNLTPKQKVIVKKIEKYEKFKKISVGSAVYIHPQLFGTAERTAGDRVAYVNDSKVDSMLEFINIRDGVKAKFFLNILSLAESAGEKVLAFSQYILPMKFLERLIVNTKGWTVGKEIFVISGDSTADYREQAMEQFNSSPDAKVFFGSIKACGEGISLVGASRVVILDVHLNPSVTRQAIGRAFRPGQTKKVYTYRLISADSPEEEDHNTAFTKELISKLWFEWNQYSSTKDFQLKTVDIESCQDLFLESPILREDIKTLYRR